MSEQQSLEDERHAATGAGDLADAVVAAASQFGDLDREGLADYVQQLAECLNDLSGQLREEKVDELARGVRRIAERHPALFVLGSIAAGIGLSRQVTAGGSRRGAGPAVADGAIKRTD